jgi:phosphoribosylaminoimidazole-succinocarboxamide synthase
MGVLYFNDPLDDCPGLGVINNRIQAMLMEKLSHLGIKSHLVRLLNMREQLVKVVEPLDFSIKMHSMLMGDLVDNLNLGESGTILTQPLREYWINGKDKTPHRVGLEHLQVLDMIDEEETALIATLCGRINDFLQGCFLALNMKLVHYNVRFAYAPSQDFWSSSLIDFCLIDLINFQKSTVIDITTGAVMNNISCFDYKKSSINGYEEMARRFGMIAPEAPQETRMIG